MMPKEQAQPAEHAERIVPKKRAAAPKEVKRDKFQQMAYELGTRIERHPGRKPAVSGFKPPGRPIMEHVLIVPVRAEKDDFTNLKSVKAKTWRRMLWVAHKKKLAPGPNMHHVWKEIGRYKAPTVPNPIDGQKNKWDAPPVPAHTVG